MSLMALHELVRKWKARARNNREAAGERHPVEWADINYFNGIASTYEECAKELLEELDDE